MPAAKPGLRRPGRARGAHPARRGARGARPLLPRARLRGRLRRARLPQHGPADAGLRAPRPRRSVRRQPAGRAGRRGRARAPRRPRPRRRGGLRAPRGPRGRGGTRARGACPPARCGASTSSSTTSRCARTASFRPWSSRESAPVRLLGSVFKVDGTAVGRGRARPRARRARRRAARSAHAPMRVVTDLPRPVRRIDHVWIPLSDGTRLGARIWLPEDAESDPVPAILEYIPYRKGDGTAHARRAAPRLLRRATATPRCAWTCAAAASRTGCSTTSTCRRSRRTRSRCCAGSPRSPGARARSGCSASRGAASTGSRWPPHAPPELKAVISLCSTDDRYADDVHYRGGAVLALEMLSWGASMLSFNAIAPGPRGRRARAGARRGSSGIDSVEPYEYEWLRHQRRDDYWKQGSVCEDFGAIECPVYAIGGWADGYTEAVFRLVAGLGAPSQGADRPVVARVPRRGRARAGDRVPPGVPALVGPLAEGRGHRDHGRAARCASGCRSR